jgi:hypothetical protein
MSLADSSAIERALLDYLSADATLTGLMPGGVWYQVAPANLTQFVVVAIADGNDQPMFGGRAWESMLYLVKAVELSTPAAPRHNARAAGDRIDALLDPQPPAPPAALTITGYGVMLLEREGRRVWDVEPQTNDATLKWTHCGARYRIWAEPD